MVSDEEVKPSEKKEKVSIKEAGGVHGWLLKKAKTFMWDAASNTLVLPKGVVLTKEEREALESVFGAIKDEAKEFDERRRLQMLAMQNTGIKFKSEITKGYTILLSGSYRELTGILANKIHDNLRGMLLVNNRFLSGVWKVISGMVKNEPEKQKKTIVSSKGRNGR